jgi:hypothetical protein
MGETRKTPNWVLEVYAERLIAKATPLAAC